MHTEISQPEGKRIMLESRFTTFPTLSVDPRVGNSRSALFFLPMSLKLLFIIRNFFYFDILRRITTFPNAIRSFSWWCKSDVTSEIYSSDVTFSIACELSQPMGKTEFSSTAKNRTNPVS